MLVILIKKNILYFLIPILAQVQSALQKNYYSFNRRVL